MNPFAAENIKQQADVNPFSLNVKPGARDAATADAEAAAEAIRLARRFPVPTEVAYRNIGDMREYSYAEDADGILRDSPKLRGWVAGDQNRFRAAKDDLLTMREIEHGVLKEWKGPTPTVSSYVTGLYKSFGQKSRVIGQGLRAYIGDAIGSEEITADALRKYQQEQSRIYGTTPDFESPTARAIYGGLTSTIGMLPGIAASIAVGNPAPVLATAGLQSGLESYGKYRVRGGSANEALVGGVAEGGLEVLTEAIPMGFLVKRFGKAGAGEFISGLLGREVVTEQIATFTQDAVDTAVANPEKTWGQFLAERPDRAYETLVSTVVQSAVFGGLNAAVTKSTGQFQQAQEAERVANHWAGLSKIASASKLLSRDSVTFKEYVSEVAEETGESPAEVYIDTENLVAVLNQSGISAEELAAVAPVVASQLGSTTVRVPVSEFLAAGEKITASLIDYIRQTPDAMNRIEAGEAIKSEVEAMRQSFDEVAEEGSLSDSISAEKQAIRAEFERQLGETKRFTKDVNSTYADLLTEFYATTAQRAGMTPAEFAQKYKLAVKSEAVQGQTMTQRETIDLRKREAVLNRILECL